MDRIEPTRFSRIIKPTGDGKPSYDTVVYESDNFVVVPSLGSMVPGWLLAIPRERIPNLSSLPTIQLIELDALVGSMRHRLAPFGGHVQTFEHGGGFGSLTSCGVDQAHLHIVPLQFDLCEVARQKTELSWRLVDGIGALPQNVAPGQEYLFASNDHQSLVAPVVTPTSQWFRKLIATEIGQPERWDYRTFPGHDNVGRTLQGIAA